MNNEERKELDQEISKYIKAGGTIKVYSEGTGRTKEGVPHSDGAVAKLVQESTDGSIP